MALPNSYPLLKIEVLSASTQSMGATPLAAVIRAPFRGKITLLAAVAHGTFVTDNSIAVTIVPSVTGGTAPGAGTAVGGSPMTLTASNSAAGTSTSKVPTGANFVNEGDLIVFTPSGSTGTTIGATYSATIQQA